MEARTRDKTMDKLQWEEVVVVDWATDNNSRAFLSKAWAAALSQGRGKLGSGGVEGRQAVQSPAGCGGD